MAGYARGGGAARRPGSRSWLSRLGLGGSAGIGDRPCGACGHAHVAHEHYRRGSDCALCDCPRYRSRRG